MGSVWGMDEATIGAIITCTAAILAVLKVQNEELRERIEVLDSNLAQALQAAVQHMPQGGDFEAPNPLQALIAQVLAQKMNTGAVQTLSSDEKGRFSKKTV